MDEPLPSPILIPCEQGWLKKVEPPPGAWVAWEMAGERGWTLRCWPVFDAQVRYEKHLKTFALDINSVHLARGDNLDGIQRAFEPADIEFVRLAHIANNICGFGLPPRGMLLNGNRISTLDALITHTVGSFNSLFRNSWRLPPCQRRVTVRLGKPCQYGSERRY
jgi:hypothetical protein